MNTEVTVREVMDREYVGASESDHLVETVELLLREGTDTAVVLRGAEPVGVVTERDVLALLVEGPDPADATVADAMTESIPTVAPDASLDAAADRMSTWDARRLVVTNGGEPLGIITEHDLLTTRTHEPQEPNQRAMESSPETARAAEPEPRKSFDEQGICEVCGAFTRDLVSFNGQVVCTDCRDV